MVIIKINCRKILISIAKIQLICIHIYKLIFNIYIVAEEYTAEEEKADAIIRYRSRESEYHSDLDSEDDIKEVDDDEETDHKLEEAYQNLNTKDKTQQRKTLDLSFLYNLGSGRAVSDFLTKFKPSSEDSATGTR